MPQRDQPSSTHRKLHNSGLVSTVFRTVPFECGSTSLPHSNTYGDSIGWPDAVSTGGKSGAGAALGHTQVFRTTEPWAADAPQRGPSDQIARARLAGRLRSVARKRVRQCRVTRTGPVVQAALRIAEGQRSLILRGISTCGSVHSCPMCAARILAGRAEQITETLQAHPREKEAFVTLTIRHHAGMPLRLLRALVAQGWTRTKTSKGGRKLRQRWGWIGDVRAIEATHGPNGWHPHLHLVVFARHRIDIGELRAALTELWAPALESVARSWLALCEQAVMVDGPGDARIRGAVLRLLGSEFLSESVSEGAQQFLDRFGALLREQRWLPSVEHGVDVQPVHGNAAALSGYMSKLGCELSAITKASTGGGLGEHRSHWQIARDAADGDVLSLALWGEYSRAMFRARHLTWSRNLRSDLGLGEVPDDPELAEEPCADGTEQLLGSWSANAWDSNVQSQSGLAVVLAALSRGEIPDGMDAAAERAPRLVFPKERVGLPSWQIAGLSAQSRLERLEAEKELRRRQLQENEQDYSSWFRKQKVKTK